MDHREIARHLNQTLKSHGILGNMVRGSSVEKNSGSLIVTWGRVTSGKFDNQLHDLSIVFPNADAASTAQQVLKYGVPDVVPAHDMPNMGATQRSLRAPSVKFDVI